MARAIEKGATYLDRLCHKFYDEPKGRGNKTDYVCRLCGGPLETYYCEERLYLVKCADCGTFLLVKTANLEDAARVTLARPTLTPPNEWVSVEERFPPPKQNVLAYSPSSGIAEADYADGIWMQYRWSAIMHGVTHWMPLPAPPERQEDT